VIHLSHQLRLALEALLGFRGEQRWRDQFDCDLAIKQRIMGSIDYAHASAAEFGDHLIAI
jgi:hypothetical protein